MHTQLLKLLAKVSSFLYIQPSVALVELQAVIYCLDSLGCGILFNKRNPLVW